MMPKAENNPAVSFVALWYQQDYVVKTSFFVGKSHSEAC